jgi:O-methyltransferase involved in polyketide biosynthesis
MSETIEQNLGGVSETLLITLYIRARESQRPDGMIKDDLAVAMVNQIDCDFSRLRMQRHDEVADTRFERVDNGQVEWFDLDVPDVITLRQKLIRGESSRYHVLAASVFEKDWLEEVSRFGARPFMFVAEGVLPYFEEAQVKSLFLNLLNHFPGCELVCDAHTPFVIWADNLHLAFAKVKARMHWSIKQGKDVEAWGEGIRLLDEWNYYDDDESQLKAFRWVRMIPPLAKSSGIFHFRLGDQS